MLNRKFKKIIPALMAVLLMSGCSGTGNTAGGGIKAAVYSFEGSAAEKSTLYVEPIQGMTDSFYRGVDVSTYISQKESGVAYKDFEGNTLYDAGFFDLLAQSGVN